MRIIMIRYNEILPLKTLIRRELMDYFHTPIAYVFLVVFLLFSGILPLQIGSFLSAGQAEMTLFFNFIPWIFVVLIPAVTMRLWAEERSNGTLEILLTLPVRLHILVFAKFIAAWLFVSFAILLTFPFWLTTNILGDPDNGVIILGYLTCLLIAGSYIALGCFISAVVRSQIVAFICGTTASFFVTVLGTQIVLDSLKDVFGGIFYFFIANLGVLKHFQAGARGVLSLGDVLYMLSVIVLCLYLNGLFLRNTQRL